MGPHIGLGWTLQDYCITKFRVMMSYEPIRVPSEEEMIPKSLRIDHYKEDLEG